MKSFVILFHTTEDSHFDILLEDNEACLTWRIDETDFQKFSIGIPVKALKLPDHRKMYLNYQGPVSGNRGDVVQYDSGEYTPYSETSDTISLVLKGKKISGTLTIKNWKSDVSWISINSSN